MPIIKNPFKKQDENAVPSASSHTADDGLAAKQPTEYKLSEISTTGEYLPPSPPVEKKTFWSNRSNGSTNSSNKRSIRDENEPFNISRESFDSYRRSFDISARSPIIPPAVSRASLDSRMTLGSRPSYSAPRPEPTKEEDDLEEVALKDDEKKPKKRGFLSHFGVESDAADKPSSGHGFHFGGRKRGQSGQGAELGDISSTVQQSSS